MPSSIKPSAAFLTLLLAAGQRALAVNDWSVPCTQGKCSWDLPVESNSSGSVNIWGPVSAISDITPAAGWQIMTKCNPTSSKQDIQLMCKDNNPDCNHLFQDNGAVNTIVRLPESCGPMPFARVAQYQVLQSNLATRGNGSEAPVHQLTLDTDFAAASPSQGGEVHFSVQGQNVRDNSGAVNRRSQRRSRSLARSQNHVYRQVLQGSDSDLSIPTFNRTLSGNPDPIGFSGQRNLFSDGSGSININTNLQASVGISTVAMGKIVPPTVTQFGITFVLDGNADAKLSVSGDLSGKVSSGNIPLFQAGFPGFSIPNILDIGPQFTLVGLIDANFGLANVNAAVEVNYDLGGASFTFPAQGGSNTNGITSSSKQVTFNASFNSGATLNASAHLIPQVSLGINALSGAASANISLDFDASLGLQGTVSPAANSQPCLSGNAQINVRLGALGSFFGLFSASTGGSPFNNNFPLFQQCFDGNANSTNSTTQSSAPATTTTDPASQTSATDATATNPASQTGAPGGAPVVPPVVPPAVPLGGAPDVTATDATATNSVSQTSSATNSASLTIVVNATTTSQTSATDATATNSASLTIVVNATTTSQTNATDATATNSASLTIVVNATTTSQTNATDATATNSASLTIVVNATTTSQTSGTDATATDSTSQTIVANATTTDSASQTSVTDATATPNLRRDAPRAVRHSARFGRSYLGLLAEPDLSSQPN